MSETTVEVIKMILSDGSDVYDVTLKQGKDMIIFNCATRREAEKLLDALKSNINFFSMERVKVVGVNHE